MKKKNLSVKKIICVLGLFLCTVGLFSCGHEHSFGEWETAISPTCGEEGVEVALCECGEKKIRGSEPLGHAPTEPETERSADCEAGGIEVTRCGVCGEVTGQKQTSPLGHDLLTAEKKEPTCEDRGWDAYQYCSRCDYSERRGIPEKGHRPSGNLTDCKTAISCIDCGKILEDAKGHREKIVYGREATCSKIGISDGKQCYDCGEVIEEQINIPKLVHTEKRVEGSPATCAVEGLSDSIECADCREILARAVVIPLRAHEYAEDGVCVVCGSRSRAPVCIHENQTVSPKVNSGCVKYGLTQGVTCDDCGEILVEQEVIEPKGHVERVIAKTEADCTRGGLSEGSKCTACGLVIRAQELIPPTGHQIIEAAGKSPDCASSGRSAGSVCGVCGETIVSSNPIPPTGHRTKYFEGKAATCTEGGWLAYSQCSDCGFTDYCEIPPMGHSEEKLARVSATCTDTGLSEGLFCCVCGEVTLAQQEIPRLGHSYTLSGKIEGGCGDAVTEVAVCRYCFSLKREGEQGGHSFRVSVISPTCTEKGSVSVSCELCAGECVISAEAVGHDLVWSVTDSGHSQKCCRDGCDYRGSESSHRSDVRALCEDVFCKDCGYKMNEGRGHNLSSVYKSDKTHHWNRCLNAYCSYEGNKSEHSSDVANCDASTAKCKVCSAYYDPQGAHLMGDWFVSSDGDLRRTCTNCNYYETRGHLPVRAKSFAPT